MEEKFDDSGMLKKDLEKVRHLCFCNLKTIASPPEHGFMNYFTSMGKNSMSTLGKEIRNAEM